MNFGDAIKKCFQNYANFNGRASRAEYWWFYLFVLITSLIPIVGLIASLATLIPIIAAGVRRMHDVGKSGWFLLIPIYNLILACTEGQKGDNEYGADPYGGGLTEDINAIGNN